MDSQLAVKRGETQTHARLKRLALFWAQANGFPICAAEVTLPRCRFRADVAAYRPAGKSSECAAIFECKQALPDFRKDNCVSVTTRQRLGTLANRRAALERLLRIHYPTLRTGDSLFPEFDSHRFDQIEHRSYERVLRELHALQNRLHAGTKFETLVRYRCADVYFLVLPNELVRPAEIPHGWGILAESDGALSLRQKPLLRETTPDARRRLLERVALTGTRQANRQLGITFEQLCEARQKCC